MFNLFLLLVINLCLSRIWFCFRFKKLMYSKATFHIRELKLKNALLMYFVVADATVISLSDLPHCKVFYPWFLTYYKVSCFGDTVRPITLAKWLGVSRLKFRCAFCHDRYKAILTWKQNMVFKMLLIDDLENCKRRFEHYRFALWNIVGSLWV